MTYRVTGKASFRTFDFECPECQYGEERMIDFRECENEEEEKMIMSSILCPNCEEHNMERVWRSAPSIRMGNDSSDHNIAKMKKSFHERFVKSGEMDQVRHKHGKLFDQSLVSAAADRIKSGES